MRKFSFSALTIAVSAVVIVLGSGYSSAMPNFARESGVSCFSCHTQPTKSLKEASLLSNVLPEESVYSAPISEDLKTGISIHTTWADSVWSDISRLRNSPVAGRSHSANVNNRSGNADNRELDSFTGLSSYIDGGSFFAGLSVMRLSNNLTNETQGNNASDLSLWYRIAYTPKLRGFNMALGVFGTSSAVQRFNLMGVESTEKATDPKTYGLDAKIAGRIGDITLDLKAMYMNTGKENALVKRDSDILDGFSAAAQVGIKQLFGLSADYRTYKRINGNEVAKGKVASIGAWVNIANNMTLASKYTAFGIDKNILTEDGVFSLLFITSF
ncbi:hypothetical protein MNBD_NITROSPINAE04-1148 [hydrothermal vent metagenome]|uniref:Uncharacterized protein n=1 Tax=hydrothermal vent metagenome TaxID=652676 RepID=A0A3B1BW00_9ZZZZ